MLKSLDGNGNPGPLADFDPTSNFSFPFAEATTISGYDFCGFEVDTSMFTNSFGGTFFVSLNDGLGSDMLVINYIPGILGDVSGDGIVDLFDISPFVDALLNGEFVLEGDINADGVIDLFDVGPFVSLLVGC